MCKVRATQDARLAACIALLFAAIAADHSIGQLHWVVLLGIMAGITGIGFATAWEPQPAMALLVVAARTKVREGLSHLDDGVAGSAGLLGGGCHR